jgi:hypothetical protein
MAGLRSYGAAFVEGIWECEIGFRGRSINRTSLWEFWFGFIVFRCIRVNVVWVQDRGFWVSGRWRRWMGWFLECEVAINFDVSGVGLCWGFARALVAVVDEDASDGDEYG